MQQAPSTDKPVLSGGYVDLMSVYSVGVPANSNVAPPSPEQAFTSNKLPIDGNVCRIRKLQSLFRGQAAPPARSMTSTVATPAISNEDPLGGSEKSLRSEQIFKIMATAVQHRPHLVETVKKIFLFTINKDGKFAANWTLDLKRDKGSVYDGTPKDAKPDCTLIMEDDLLADIFEGKQDPQRAFMTGKLRIQGDVLASQKLEAIWNEEYSADEADPWDEESPAEYGLYNYIGPSDYRSMPPTGVKTDFAFRIFAERIHEEPDIAKKMNVVYHWIVLQNGKKVSEWTTDLKTGNGEIYIGPPKGLQPDCVITAEDDVLVKLALDRANPQRAFMMGKLKISGNVMMTLKLSQLLLDVYKSGRAVELPFLISILADDKPLNIRVKNEAIVLELAKRISRMPDVISKVQAVYEFVITKDEEEVSHWTFDLKKDKGSIYRGEPKQGKAELTLTMDDDDFADWCAGVSTPERLAWAGRCTSSGDVALAARLNEVLRFKSKL